MADRTYFQGREPLAWHALDPDASDPGDWSYVGLCGRHTAEDTKEADRVPPAGHLCGACSRSIAAQSDVEAAFASERDPIILKPDMAQVTGA